MDLEELLVQEGVAVPPEQLRRVLSGAEDEGRNPVAALVDEGILAEDVLAEVLARAYGTVVVDLDRGIEVEDDAPHLVSGAIARAHLVLPVAHPIGGKLRVVFANPLDDDAASAVERSAGVPIQRLVATLTGLRQAIEKAYAGRTTRVVHRDRDMPPEITRRVEVPDGALGTSPLHRLEQEATIEQRHEALLLALVERGVLTRADYVEALKRLLSNRRED